MVLNQQPRVANEPGGQGVAKQAVRRHSLVDWFKRLQTRLEMVIVLNHFWEAAITPTKLMHTPTSPKPMVGILLDSPYVTEERTSSLYHSDSAGVSSATAQAAYEWAVAHGERYRIAYCSHVGDFPPAGPVGHRRRGVAGYQPNGTSTPA